MYVYIILHTVQTMGHSACLLVTCYLRTQFMIVRVVCSVGDHPALPESHYGPLPGEDGWGVRRGRCQRVNLLRPQCLVSPPGLQAAAL